MKHKNFMGFDISRRRNYIISHNAEYISQICRHCTCRYRFHYLQHIAVAIIMITGNNIAVTGHMIRLVPQSPVIKL